MKEEESTHRNTSDEPTDRSQKHTENPNSKVKSISNRQHKIETQKSEKELAAIQIQAAFRGYYIRKEIEKAKENNEPLPQRKYNPLPKIKKAEKTSQEKQPNSEKISQQKDIEKPSRPEKRKSDEHPKHQNLPEKNNLINNNSENKTKERAARKIQAGFRGYLARKNIRKDPDPVTYGDSFQNLEDSTDTEKTETEKIEIISNETVKAAIIIQAGFRGFKTRRNLKHDKQHTCNETTSEQCEEKEETEDLMEESKDDEMKFEKAAVTIQAGFRSFKTRKHFRERERAAEKIQAGYRGYKVRQDKKVKEHAAIRIQAGFRGFKARNESKRMAIEKIQAGFRGYQYRKDLENKSDDDSTKVFTEEQEKLRNDAAVKIQAAFRGHVYRREKI